jgi:hypothetical protein
MGHSWAHLPFVERAWSSAELSLRKRLRKRLPSSAFVVSVQLRAARRVVRPPCGRDERRACAREPSPKLGDVDRIRCDF